MSHELIANSQGIIEAAFRVEPAWHGLGAVMGEDTSYEDFGKAAGLTTWKIQRSKVRYSVDRNDAVGVNEWPEQHVLFRSDSKAPIGMVSDSYKVVQPHEIYGFFRDFVEKHNFKMEAAGVLRGGGRFWALAQMPGVSDLGGDITVPYVLLSTSADGSLATEARFTAVRVVCANTLAYARAQKADFRATHRSLFDPAKAAKALAKANAQFAQYHDTAEKMAAFTVTSAQAAVILAGLLNPKAADLKTGAVNGAEMDKVRESKAWQTIVGLFSGAGNGSMNDASRGTAFGMLQAMTEYYDHHCQARSDENRFISGQYGTNATRKTDAYEALAAMVNAA